MSQMEFVIGVLVSAASWMIGIAIARFVMRRYLGWTCPTNGDPTVNVISCVS